MDIFGTISGYGNEALNKVKGVPHATIFATVANADPNATAKAAVAKVLSATPNQIATAVTKPPSATANGGGSEGLAAALSSFANPEIAKAAVPMGLILGVVAIYYITRKK